MGRDEMSRNKYRAVKTTVDGIRFDSKAEAKRYTELRYRELAGEIERLTLQPRFPILPPFTRDGVHYRAVMYTADFQYYDKLLHRTVVEEFKGMRTRDYVVRMKFFVYQNPEYLFREVHR